MGFLLSDKISIDKAIRAALHFPNSKGSVPRVLSKSLGNHEFDNGINGLTPFIKNLTCPVLCSNLDLRDVPDLSKLTNLKKSVVLEVAGRKIGIVGYLTPETKNLAVPNDVEYVDEIEAIRKEVKELKNGGIRIIIALGHSGYLKDLEIAKKVEGVDIVIGGHTNTFLWNGTSPDSENPQDSYPTYVVQSSGKSISVLQAYAYTKYLGKMHLIFDMNGDIISANGTPILLDNTIPQDPFVMELTNKYRRNLVNVTEEVVGYTSIVLDGMSCSYKECNLGNLITDAMVFRYAVDYKGQHWTDASIAIIQAGGIRASLAHTKTPANITKGELLTILPFGGTLVAVSLNGTVLIKMIEHSVSTYNVSAIPGPFLQYSGIKVIYDVKKPVGARVVKAEAKCSSCEIPSYSKIVNEEMYKIIMTSFIAMGGDGYAMFKGLPTETLNYNEELSTEYYVARHSPIYPEVEGRIAILPDDQINAYSRSFTLRLSSMVFLIVLFTF